MKRITLFLFLVSTITCFAEYEFRSKVKVTGGSSGTSGGRMPEKLETAYLSYKKVSNELKIETLRDKIKYYEFLIEYSIDDQQTIDAEYLEAPLSEALQAFIPNVPIIYEGTSEQSMIREFISEGGALYEIFNTLDNAADVEFLFSKKGLTVKSYK